MSGGIPARHAITIEGEQYTRDEIDALEVDENKVARLCDYLTAQAHEHMKGFNPRERFNLCLITSYRLLIVFVNYLNDSKNPREEAAALLDHLHERMRERILNKVEALVSQQNQHTH